MLQMEGESGGSGNNGKGDGRKGKIKQNEVPRFTPTYSSLTNSKLCHDFRLGE